MEYITSGKDQSITSTSSQTHSSLAKRPRLNDQSITSGKETSEVWAYFRKEMVGEKLRVLCNFCDKDLSAKQNHGTTHLWAHYGSCPKRDKSVTSTPSRRSKGKEDTFDKEVSRGALAQAIIMHEYPISIVEHIGFRRFVSSLEPRFKMVSRGTIKRDILKIYDYEKNKTFELLRSNSSRVALTTDMWTSGNGRVSLNSSSPTFKTLLSTPLAR